MPGPGLEVGNVYARLGAKMDDDGFNRWERKYDEAERKSKRRIEAHAGVKTDTTGLDHYNRRLSEANRHNDDFVRGSGRMKTGLGSLFVGGAGVAAAGVGFYALARGVGAATNQFKESQQIQRQTAQVIKSTGGEANVSAGHVDKYANALARKTGIDDETVASGENLLLTFTNIRNEAGKGNDIFNQSTSVMLDMSKALGQDTKSSAIQLGKALNDPIKGITALQRVGVSFTAQQKEQITTLVKSGKTVEAQKLILRELNKEFGGSAAATATWQDRLKVTVGNVEEAIGGKINPWFEKASKRVDAFVDGMLRGEGAGGRFGASMKRTGRTIEQDLGGAFDYVGDRIHDNNKSVSSIGQSFSRAFGSVKRLLAGFERAIKDTFGAKSGTGKDIKNIINALFTIVAAAAKFVTQLNAKLVKPVIQIFRGFAQILRGLIRIISGLVTGDFGKMWDGVKDIFSGAVKIIIGHLRVQATIFKTVAGLLVKAFLAGIRALASGAAAAGKWLAGQVIKGLEGAPALAVKIGKKILGGTIAGMKAEAKALFSIGKWITDQITKGLGKLTPHVDLNPFGSPRPSEMGAATGHIPKTGTYKFAQKVAEKFGLRITSGYRSPEHNAAVGGVPNSLHTHGSASNPGAIDEVGSYAAMQAAAAYARKAGLPEVLVHDVGSGLHLHLGFFARGGKVGPGAGGARAFIAGEGSKDEWVISQEGNRQKNIGWAMEALHKLTGKRAGLFKDGGKIGASFYGGPTDKSSGHTGYREANLNKHPYSFAELDYGKAMGGLPNKARVQVDGPSGSAVVEKNDIGDGGDDVDGVHRGIDLWWRIKNYIMGNRGLAVVTWKRVPKNTKLGPLGKGEGGKKKKRSNGTPQPSRYDLAIAKSDVRIANAESTQKTSDDIKAKRARVKLLRHRLKQVEDALKSKKISKAHRLALLQEQSGIRSEMNGLNADIYQLEHPETPDTGGSDTGGDTGDGSSDLAPEPPSPLQIATAAAEQLSAFNNQRAELFSNYGSNYVVAGNRPFGDDSSNAAGMQRYGTFGASDQAAGGGGTTKTIHITNNYGGGPDDPHTWSQRTRFELEAAL